MHRKIKAFNAFREVYQEASKEERAAIDAALNEVGMGRFLYLLDHDGEFWFRNEKRMSHFMESEYKSFMLALMLDKNDGFKNMSTAKHAHIPGIEVGPSNLLDAFA